MMSTLLSILVSLSLLAITCQSAAPSEGASGQAEPPATAPAGPAPAEAEPPEVADEPSASQLPDHLDALLTDLEAGAKDLTGFTADITYEKYDDLLGRREVRSGELLYRVDPGTGQKTFSLRFDRLIENRRLDESVKHYVFDGRWLAEIDHERKQFIKRELVPPGETLDPLKLGEGPIPLPIGQEKAEVLKRFEVDDATLPEEGLLARLSGEAVDGVRLRPRSNTSEADEFERIDLFYDKQTKLPVGIEALEHNANKKIVRLTNVERNPEFTKAMLDRFVLIDPDPREWRIDIQPWQGRP